MWSPCQRKETKLEWKLVTVIIAFNFSYAGEFSNVDISQDLDRLLALQAEESASSFGQ